MSESSTRDVARGAFILVLANFIVKVIGIFYKIPITNMAGPLAMSYFNSAFEVQQVLLTVSISLPLAVSKMVAESAARGRGDEVRRIFRVTLVTFTCVGLLCTGIFILGAPAFAAASISVKAQYAMIALAPSLFLYAIAATFRGLYQGLGNMLPTAATQITEALTKLGFGVLLTYFAVRAGMGPEYVATAAISGTTISIVFSILILIPLYFLPRTRQSMKAIPSGGECDPPFKLLRRLLAITIPVTLSSLIVNLTSFLDLFCINDRLQFIGMTEEAANTAYGGYKSYAQLLFNLPPSLIASVGLGIVPAIAAAHVSRKFERRNEIMNSAFRIVILLALPCAAGLTFLADPILHMLFRNPTFADQVDAAVPLMRMLGVASLWACVASVTTSCLQGINKLRYPLISLGIGGALKLICNFTLVGIPDIGINGAPIGTNLCYIAIILSNTLMLRRHTELHFDVSSTFIKPLAAGLLMGGFSLGSYWVLHTCIGIGLTVSCLASILLSALFYGACLVLLRCLTAEDLALLPKGERIAAALRARRIIK